MSGDLVEPEALLEVATRVVARAASGEQVEAFVVGGTETEIRAYDGAVESLTVATSAGIGVRVIRDHRLGFAWAGSLDGDVIDRALEDARDNVAFATADEHVALAVPDGVVPATLDVWSDDVAATPTADKVALAVETEGRARGCDPRIRQVDSVDYADATSAAAVASTTGISAAWRRTSAYLTASLIAGDGDDSHSGYGLSAQRGFGGLDADRVVSDARERSVRLLGATKGRSMRTTVVFDRRVASTLLAIVASALSGDAVAKGRSFFVDRMGEEVAVPDFTLVDDPTDPRSFGASAFDGEGLACRRTELISSGVLSSFVYDTQSASRAGARSTASALRGASSTPSPGCRALVLAPGEGSVGRDEILAQVGEGLYVQSITGVHSGVSPVSGDFSVGAEGLVIRDGRLAEPVREITVASSLQRMLHSVVAIGGDLEWLPGVAAGQTLAIGEMQVSGT